MVFSPQVNQLRSCLRLCNISFSSWDSSCSTKQYSPDSFLSRTCSASPACFNTLMMPEGIKDDITDSLCKRIIEWKLLIPSNTGQTSITFTNTLMFSGSLMEVIVHEAFNFGQQWRMEYRHCTKIYKKQLDRSLNLAYQDSGCLNKVKTVLKIYGCKVIKIMI